MERKPASNTQNHEPKLERDNTPQTTVEYERILKGFESLLISNLTEEDYKLLHQGPRVDPQQIPKILKEYDELSSSRTRYSDKIKYCKSICEKVNQRASQYTFNLQRNDDKGEEFYSFNQNYSFQMIFKCIEELKKCCQQRLKKIFYRKKRSYFCIGCLDPAPQQKCQQKVWWKYLIYLTQYKPYSQILVLFRDRVIVHLKNMKQFYAANNLSKVIIHPGQLFEFQIMKFINFIPKAQVFKQVWESINALKNHDKRHYNALYPIMKEFEQKYQITTRAFNRILLIDCLFNFLPKKYLKQLHNFKIIDFLSREIILKIMLSSFSDAYFRRSSRYMAQRTFWSVFKKQLQNYSLLKYDPSQFKKFKQDYRKMRQISQKKHK